MKVLKKLRSALNNAGSIKRDFGKSYTLFVGETEIKIALDSDFYKHQISVYINDRPWYTGIEITKEVTEFIAEVQRRDYDLSKLSHDIEKKEIREIWNNL